MDIKIQGQFARLASLTVQYAIKIRVFHVLRDSIFPLNLFVSLWATISIMDLNISVIQIVYHALTKALVLASCVPRDEEIMDKWQSVDIVIAGKDHLILEMVTVIQRPIKLLNGRIKF